MGSISQSMVMGDRRRNATQGPSDALPGHTGSARHSRHHGQADVAASSTAAQPPLAVYVKWKSRKETISKPSCDYDEETAFTYQGIEINVPSTAHRGGETNSAKSKSRSRGSRKSSRRKSEESPRSSRKPTSPTTVAIIALLSAALVLWMQGVIFADFRMRPAITSKTLEIDVSGASPASSPLEEYYSMTSARRMERSPIDETNPSRRSSFGLETTTNRDQERRNIDLKGIDKDLERRKDEYRNILDLEGIDKDLQRRKVEYEFERDKTLALESALKSDLQRAEDGMRKYSPKPK
ncbi:hypothetical protein THAOC_03920 [Thalassiosira oceanica]|uniref:Uncharacterized protein n=1 Tax=Thalassiosira oceanica TaxID=159749 RepID=K0T6H6_THAOC|nr:hypothetical protein THAOC_03920 [Thalassiosira oceanica]|eukprot:EJK74403.1 hypothetical protein THAOC_03920 [Thalassiosira oceanica]